MCVHNTISQNILTYLNNHQSKHIEVFHLHVAISTECDFFTLGTVVFKFPNSFFIFPCIPSTTHPSPPSRFFACWLIWWFWLCVLSIAGFLLCVERLAAALGVMNSAVSSPGVPLRAPTIPPPPIPGQTVPSILSSIYGSSGAVPDYSTLSAAPPPPPPPVPDTRKKTSNEPKAPPLSGAGSIPHSFKDLVAMKAMEENLEFYPVAGKSHEARQVCIIFSHSVKSRYEYKMYCTTNACRLQ